MVNMTIDKNKTTNIKLCFCIVINYLYSDMCKTKDGGFARWLGHQNKQLEYVIICDICLLHGVTQL